MDAPDRLDECLNNTRELEAFLHAFLGGLDERELKAGDDITQYVDRLGLKLPAVLQGSTITWEGTAETHERMAKGGREDVLVLTQPGHPGALGLVIKCVKIGKWKFCLECGWFWCRIVVTRRF